MSDKTPSLDQFENFDFRELPIGVYMTSLDGQFIVCNRTLRKMLGLPLDGPVQANIKQYYINPGEREEAIAKVLKASQSGNGSGKTLLEFRIQGRNLFVEDYCQPLRDPNTGEVDGFAGCLVDITDEHEDKLRERELQNRVEELTTDIGSILHSNTTTLLMVMQSLNSVIEAFMPNPFGGVGLPPMEEIDVQLTEHAERLAGAIERFLKVGDEERRLKALPQHKWDTLSTQLTALREFKQRVPVLESQPVVLRVAAHKISQISQSVEPGFLPREAVRDLQQASWHLERITTLVGVLKTRTAVMQMDYTLQSLREYITADVRETAKRKSMPVSSLVEQAVSRLAGYAESSRVEIRTYEVAEALVDVNEREIVRALSNLLHNAIKYTWRRDQTKAPWVSIRAKVENRNVYVEFENWGVPVSKEEIEQGLVFKLGYRGNWSTDRGRLGTGIGLTDSRRIAESHGGGILLESNPTRIHNETHSDYFKQPFLTKVTLHLPITGRS